MRRDKQRVLDEYLVAAARTGDRQAFARLAKNWQPVLLRHAWRLTGDADLARDTLQDAWLDIVRGLHTLSDSAAFPAWAYKIVTRKCANTIRKLQKHRRTRDAVAAEPVKVHDGEAEASSRADLYAVSRAMAALPPAQRSVMALYHVEDMPVAEIARALSIPPGTVKTRLMHARRKIRAVLEAVDQYQGDEDDTQ